MLILTFHAIDDQGDVLAYAPQQFRRLIALLHANGYQSARLGEDGDRKVVITFDDAYQSVVEAALPVLNEYGMQATVFVTGLDSLQGRATMRWGAIRELDAAGWEIGAHTCTHPDLTSIDIKQAETEIVQSKEMIEQILGKAVRGFAYPFGRYNHAVRDITAAYYEIALSDRLALVSESDDQYSLPRLDTYYFRGDSMRWLTSQHLGAYVRLRALPRNLRRWMTRR